MEATQLQKILEKHRQWLNNEPGGMRAEIYGGNLCNRDLRGADLRGSNLTGADLKYADLEGANLTEANFTKADLAGANLTEANFTKADLIEANLRGAILTGANLTRAILTGANLTEANLEGANLTGANLTGAYLIGANLTGAIGIPPIACPETGSFIGYKKARTIVGGERIPCIVKLSIPEDAKRSSATTRKCRCSKAEVLSITTLSDDSGEYGSAYSFRDNNFKYTVGETVDVSDFDDNRWNECAPGIHFFMSREEAVDYGFN